VNDLAIGLLALATSASQLALVPIYKSNRTPTWVIAVVATIAVVGAAAWPIWAVVVGAFVARPIKDLGLLAVVLLYIPAFVCFVPFGRVLRS
jgi:hypothetical protein